MALPFLDNVEYQGKKQNFQRDGFATIADMKAFNENYLPDVFIAVCYEDGNIYLFNRNNTTDATTGKWRKFEGSGVTEEYAPPAVKSKKCYYGTSATGIVTTLDGLNNFTITLAETPFKVSSVGQYIVIALPESDNEVSIKDSNGLNYSNSFTTSTLSYDSVSYKIYVSESPVVCSDFEYRIIY